MLGHRAAYRQRLRLCSGAEHLEAIVVYLRIARHEQQQLAALAPAERAGSRRIERRKVDGRGHLIVGLLHGELLLFPGELGLPLAASTCHDGRGDHGHDRSG